MASFTWRAPKSKFFFRTQSKVTRFFESREKQPKFDVLPQHPLV
jgi:hypothetical protein